MILATCLCMLLPAGLAMMIYFHTILLLSNSSSIEFKTLKNGVNPFFIGGRPSENLILEQNKNELRKLDPEVYPIVHSMIPKQSNVRQNETSLSNLISIFGKDPILWFVPKSFKKPVSDEDALIQNGVEWRLTQFDCKIN